MNYSKFHKSKNPFSPARLNEAFKASKMEGGPGDPVKVTVDKDEKAGTVTVTKSTEGESNIKTLTPEQKAWRDEQVKKLGSVEAYRKKYNIKPPQDKERKALESFTYRTLDFQDPMRMKLMDEDIDIEMAPIPDDYLPPEEPTKSYTYTTSETKKKKKTDTVKHPKIKDDGLSKTCSEDPTACVAPIGDQSKKALRGAERKRKMEIKASKKRDRQIKHGKFAPKQWFEEKMYQRDISKAIKQRKRDQKKRSRNTPIKDFFSDISFNKPKEKPTSRTIKASF